MSSDLSDDDMPLARAPRTVPTKMDIDSNGICKRKSRSSLNQVQYKDESDTDDAVPLLQAKRQRKSAVVDSDSDDTPLAKKKSSSKAVSKANGKANGKPNTKAIKKEESDDDVPLSKSKPRKPAAKKTKPESDDDEPIKGRRQSSGASKKSAATSAAKKSAPAKDKANGKPKKEEDVEDEEEEEEEYAWWDATDKADDSIKWTTLEHNGVLFPPEYTPLPKNVKLLYDGKPVDLAVEAEEVAYFFGSMLNSTQNVENPVFQKNFFGDFTAILEKTGGAKDKTGKQVAIKEFEKLDFRKIYEYSQAQNQLRKARSSEQKKAEKAEKDKMEAPFMYCKWDGRKEKVGNFRVEPPSLFRGRGEHPKTGKVKLRVMPEQVTINIGKDAKVPEPPAGHKWKAVQHDNKATWIAMWQENINGAYKYVMLDANSAIKGQSDFKKFEKARELKKHIDRIRRDYTKDLSAKVMADRQRATAMYLIDKLALRAGNEKDTENEAETVGCCSLKFEHITLKEPSTVVFDFLGKDSIRYYDEVPVDRQVFKNMKLFKKPPKTTGDDIFDRLNTTQLNKHLSSYMPGLTAKVFRTYNASFTMAKLLRELKVDNRPVQEKVKLYNDCNRQVAILCNHKRTVGAGHEAQMEKLSDKIKAVVYKRWRMKMMLLDIDTTQKKKKGAAYFKRDEDLSDEWVAEHQVQLVQKMRDDITKKFAKDNEKRTAEKESLLPQSELKTRLQAADELAAKFKKEKQTKKIEAEGKSPTVEKIVANIEKLDTQIANLQLQAEDREGNKEVALSTSKINYIDPRLTVVFSKKFGVPIEKFFSKRLREKFNWAIKSVGDEDWEF
ncbi:DNA topoisomerase 1 [Ceratocystis fimbriata CBS 114723]|uniref:DNA topoisomerase I n=1 Tax=Ceratocystis fimbriata CBS 114723 TaxID=1035309 RepID=A0A2C5WUR2_9PEZI|nr:DNA topoisomerase 1 [Ceratocystis fimbriata CBS 114723]